MIVLAFLCALHLLASPVATSYTARVVLYIGDRLQSVLVGPPRIFGIHIYQSSLLDEEASSESLSVLTFHTGCLQHAFAATLTQVPTTESIEAC
jgi:hypothetical protein